jgi:hypothetical protein
MPGAIRRNDPPGETRGSRVGGDPNAVDSGATTDLTATVVPIALPHNATPTAAPHPR